jgi:predicted metalloprotease with PDZ domain
MSVRDSSRLAWVKLYMGSPDGQNRFPSYYLKGGVVMWMLDLYVIAHSDGKASLDDALRGLWKRYMQTPSVGLAEDEAIAIMERSTGVQLRDRLMDWLDGTEELPIAEMLAPFGYTLEIKTRSAEEITFGENRLFAHVPPEVFVGWTLADRNGDVVVRGVEDRSPAFEAGIGIDDELVSVNGQRIQSVAALNQLLAMDGAHEVTLEAQTDGVMYTTKLVPQPDTFVTIQSVAAPSDTQQHLRSVWLQRNL